ncbi:MAG: DNA polymerase III subunit gamma/tau [Candidatus Babeliales bacterium]
MAHGQLNLARKWRSQTFKEIVGQPLVVSMLQNSLYSGHIFPVYLLSGQRGCGKTSTARVFAAAVNCQKLAIFRAKPKEQVLPCLACGSCRAMQAGNHPDVIEMDAASHTGVDNVRQIIEAASFLPLLGAHKVYLIDEAHMLSKAAFNALLKILEEPPASVIFLLATTDPHKIIETVTSRCFRLFFAPIDTTILEQHLEKICKQESIAYELDGLQAIVAESEGSCRDAINLLEQVRFATDVVNKAGVQRVLGHLDDERLVELISTILLGEPALLITLLDKLSLAHYSAPFIWHTFILMLRAALWHTCNVPAQCYAAEGARIVRATGVSSAMLIKVLRTLYEQEKLFTKTTAQHGMLEMMFITLCSNIGNQTNQAGHNKIVMPAQTQSASVVQPVIEMQSQQVPEQVVATHVPETIRVAPQKDAGWDLFLQALAGGGYDPLIVSIFTQGHYKVFDTNANVVQVTFPKSFEMFQDMLVGAQHLWQPLLQQAFGKEVTLQPAFSVDMQTAPQPPKTMVTIQVPVRQTPQAAAQKPAYKSHAGSSASRTSSTPKKNEQKVDISDASTWQKAHELVQAFDGIVTQEEDGPHE